MSRRWADQRLNASTTCRPRPAGGCLSAAGGGMACLEGVEGFAECGPGEEVVAGFSLVGHWEWMLFGVEDQVHAPGAEGGDAGGECGVAGELLVGERYCDDRQSGADGFVEQAKCEGVGDPGG